MLGRVGSPGGGAASSGPAWLDGPGGRSTDELLALEGNYRTDSLVVAFESAIQAKQARGLVALSGPERVVLAVELLEREVNNGGFNQLFLNGEPELIRELVAALGAIDRPAVADLVLKAMDVLGTNEPAALRAAAADTTDAQDEELDALDASYYATAGDLAGPLLEFIKLNRASIVV